MGSSAGADEPGLSSSDAATRTTARRERPNLPVPRARRGLGFCADAPGATMKGARLTCMTQVMAGGGQG